MGREALLFPGVGSFGCAMEALHSKGFVEPLRAYIASGRPYMGICVGMQVLFEGSEESAGVAGLGVIPARAERFSTTDGARGARKAVPHMGWSKAELVEWGDGEARAALGARYGLSASAPRHYYFVHSYRVPFCEGVRDWALATTQYGDETFVSVVQRGNVFATQFHPEKSGRAGLALLDAWLSRTQVEPPSARHAVPTPASARAPTRRIVACLDVRSNDDGDLVVTKGESYDVRERAPEAGAAPVRNMGKPVELAQRYYEEGADEVAFLNITSFREWALGDQPMLSLLNVAAATIFVPLTIGGGIRDFTDPDGTFHPALNVAHAYFRAGADKVSIGSEAVYAVEQVLARAGGALSDPAAAPAAALQGDTGIEQISHTYGAQAVVVSIDPKRVYVEADAEVPPAHAASLVAGVDERPATAGQPARWWYQCTVKGGRELRDIDAVQLARGAERLGAGELLINSIDRDGSNNGFDVQLMDLVRGAVNIPVVASSGAGCVQHFTEVFAKRSSAHGAPIEAALAAGIFHRREVSIADVKAGCAQAGYDVRLD
ncbi:unnamed protein product [Malassezia sympodialis ATCC 42132]|uniref:uncharacterized protein n=1 Tax=Malassezia sympodialis (strain ATCC 42132) TaxID=1230383 RepID=UPI0002C2CAD8|nr:uncharacterized protein MSY001_0522 [Malassezia sympodialis ATCC 42132]CCU97816.1 unnamed protein product [Malassezia sympodialis ATCC 42132]|eukprot:XP_018739150.1 uncharacterized protein MSY001_0522 [Malassezia sympodialis ATCC 42132]